MWADFVASWDLFGTAYTTGLLCAVMLSLVGVVTVAQRQAFLGVAVAQAATLGIALALAVDDLAPTDDHHAWHGLPWLFGIAFAVLACLAMLRRHQAVERSDAVGAVVFLAGAAGSVLLLSHSPHGLDGVERLMFSTLIGADAHDVVTFSASTIVTVAVVFARRQTLLLVAIDPDTAHAIGIRVRAWSIGLAIWAGVLIGGAIHSSGTLFTFACLVLPTLIAKATCRRMQTLFVVAPLAALGTTFAGFVVGNHRDLPLGQTAVGVQVLGWMVVCGIGLTRRRP
jgi:ABC-type Mn2+/Zn2+ transport system permease subunit